jgi:hypothetical protein
LVRLDVEMKRSLTSAAGDSDAPPSVQVHFVHQHMDARARRSAMVSRVGPSITAPLGLCGRVSTTSRVRGVMATAMASGSTA